MIRATVVPAAFAALLIFASCAALAGGPGLVGGPAVGNRAGFGTEISTV